MKEPQVFVDIDRIGDDEVILKGLRKVLRRGDRGGYHHAIDRDNIPENEGGRHNIGVEQTRASVAANIREYLEAFLNYHRPKDTRDVVRGVRFSLNDWAEKLGIGLVSLSITPFNQMGGANARRIDIPVGLGDDDYPTIGLIPGMDRVPQAIVGFPTSTNESLMALSRRFDVGRARTEDEVRNEPVMETMQAVEGPDGFDNQVLVVLKGMHALLRVPLLNETRLNRAKIPYREVPAMESGEFQQAYMFESPKYVFPGGHVAM